MWTIFDLETTGLNLKDDRVIEYGAVLYDPVTRSILKCESQLVCSDETKLTEEITELTGITYDMLAKRACTYSMFCDRLKAWIEAPGVTHLVAHYGKGFDIPIAQMEFVRQNRTMPEIPVIDTWEDVPWKKSAKNKSLPYLAADHGFVNPFPHRALPDVLTLTRLISEYDPKDIEFRAASPSVILQGLHKFEENEIAKKYGFRFNPATKKWILSVKQFELEKLTIPFPTQQVMA